MESTGRTAFCALCGCREMKPFVCYDDFEVATCVDCGSGVVTNISADSHSEDMRDDYSHRYEQERQAEKPQACWSLAREHTNNFQGIRSLLDIGCGEGDFLNLAKAAGIATYGIEISMHAASVCTRLGHNVACRSIEESEFELAQRPDLCVMWDLLEHLQKPRAALVNVFTVLPPGGRVLIATPMMGSIYDRLGSLLYRLSGRRIKSLLRMCWTSEHLFRFEPQGIARVLKDIGFVDIKVKPLTLLSLAPTRYAGGAVMSNWTTSETINRVISVTGVFLARTLRCHNKILIAATKMETPASGTGDRL